MHVLITGAGGYLGARLAHELAVRAGINLTLCYRPSQQLSLPPSAIAVDLTQANPFASVDSSEITHVVHTAAVTRFNVERELAQAVNIDGARKVYEFASRCPKLSLLLQVSTLYAGGMEAGPQREEPFGGVAGFANHYEWSKFEAERELQTSFAGLPRRIARVCTVISDDTSGKVSQFNAFHHTLKLLYYGLISLVPGDAATPLYFVTAEYAVAALVKMLSGDSAPIVHVSPSREQALTLGALLDVVFSRFEQDESFKKRRVLRPLYTDFEAFRLLTEGMGGMGGAVIADALGSITPFARQLFVKKDVSNVNLMALTGKAPDESMALARAVSDYLVRTRFGREGA